MARLRNHARRPRQNEEWPDGISDAISDTQSHPSSIYISCPTRVQSHSTIPQTISKAKQQYPKEGERRLTPWTSEMKYISIIFKHVDLLNTGDLSDIQFLECCLEFSVISLGRCLGLFDDFTSGSSFSTYS